MTSGEKGAGRAAAQGQRPREPVRAAGWGGALELLGLVGLLGLGWIYAGQVGTGILLLLAWWVLMAVAFVLLAGAAFFSRALFFGLLAFFALVWLAIPLASALGVRTRLRHWPGGPARSR